ncbi:MAG: hypothetical protein QOE26_1982 [Verrucomicrobiota bacterium]|jgi:predicted ATPase
MWINSLELHNVRAFKAEKVELSKGINVFVGPNNAGKSTVLLPLLSLQDGLPKLDRSDVRIYASDARVNLSFVEPEPTFFNPTFETLEQFYIEFRKGQTEFNLRGNINRNGQVVGFHRFQKREPNNFIYPFVSKRKVGSLGERVTDQTVEDVPSTFENLNAKIDRLSNPGFQPAHDLYVRACNEILGFQVFASHTAEGKRAVYTVRNMINIPLLSMGEGVTNILGLIVHLAIAENRLFLIEEPENDVHPKALKGLMALIAEKASENQFIITTHSNIVLKKLGSVTGSKVFEVVPDFVDRLPTSVIKEIGPSSEDRRRVLESLGYELNDVEIWQGWLLLEESSAEKIIREYLIPWFTPELSTKLRTYSAHSISEVTPRFKDFNELFVFLHLEPVYKNRSWVLVDGGNEEKDVIDQLKAVYANAGWRPDQFQQLSQHEFERYYPSQFQDAVSDLGKISNKASKREAKKGSLPEGRRMDHRESSGCKGSFCRVRAGDHRPFRENSFRAEEISFLDPAICKGEKESVSESRQIKAVRSPTRQTDVGDIGGVEGLGGVAFLGVEDDDILDDASLFQDHVDVLGTHARLGQPGQVAAPFFVEANGDHLSGMVSGPVAVPSGLPFTNMTSTPPPGSP